MSRKTEHVSRLIKFQGKLLVVCSMHSRLSCLCVRHNVEFLILSSLLSQHKNSMIPHLGTKDMEERNEMSESSNRNAGLRVCFKVTVQSTIPNNKLSNIKKRKLPKKNKKKMLMKVTSNEPTNLSVTTTFFFCGQLDL